MKEHYIYHSAEIVTDKFYLPGTFVIHYHEQGEDYSRRGIKESFLFDGLSINFIIFELTIGVKVYDALTF